MDPTAGVGEALLGGSECVSSVTEEEAQRRVDLAVSPNGKKWIDIHQAFHDLLADGHRTIGQILPAFFTPHEICLFVLSESAILKAIQQDNSHRFHRLLQGRLQGVTPDIPTKLTMLYFGLPVEPEDFSRTEKTFYMENRKSEPPRDAANPPLNFLTAHKERNWGIDGLLGQDDPSYPVRPPQHLLKGRSVLREGQLDDGQPVVHLRGGRTDDKSDWAENFSGLSSNDSDGDDEDGSDGDGTMEDQPDPIGVDHNTESEDANMQRTDSDEVISSERKADPRGGNWINLYGFQGRVPFIPGDRQTYEDAIRRLLSLGPQDCGNFSIVHFDNKADTIDTINDTLPLKPDSTTLHFIAEKAPKGGKIPNKRHSFFIKLEKEPIPEHWQPSEEQLNTTVSSVLYTPEGEHSQRTNAPASCCYLCSPSSHGSRPSQEAVCGWGADQCNEYLKTAFEVLLGQPKGLFHHAFFRLGQCNSDFVTAPPIYGFSAISSSDILSLIPAGDGTLSSLRCTQLGDKEIAFALPGFHITGSLPPDESGKNSVAGLLSFIRQMISSAFGDGVKHLKYVRLLDGRATLGASINRNQDYYSIRMSDDLSQKSEISYASALSKIVAAGNPFVLLYPEWEQDQSFLSMTGDDGVEHRVRMPPLSSTLEDLWHSVFDLMFRAGLDHRRHKELHAGDAFISIQPKINYEPVGATLDAPCFFIGPEATDEQWFSIRARIPTSVASIKIHDSETFDWRAQVDKSCVWGPRYGAIAGVQSATRKAEMTVAREQYRDEPVQEAIDYTTRENDKKTVEDAVRETVTGSITSRAPKASLGDEKPTRKTHADPTKILTRLGVAAGVRTLRRRAWAAQPSIFDNYGRFPRLANSGIQLPAYAPPVEHMLRTGPRMPMISKAILTPTEQGELQRITWDLRGLCLNRTMRCPYEGCRFAYRIDNQQAVIKHLEASHTGRKCMWCNDVMPGHWNAGKVHRHMREKHRDMLMEALGVNKATIRRFDGQGTISVPLKKAKRCEEPPPTTPAPDGMDFDEPKSHGDDLTKCSGFCDRCGRGANYPDAGERANHDDQCNGSSAVSGKYCLYCGEGFKNTTTQADWNRNAAHMAACYGEQGGAASLLKKPDIAAFRQQQKNLRLQVLEAGFDAIESDEEESGMEDMDLDDAHEEPERPRPAERLVMKKYVQDTTDAREDDFSKALRAAMEAAGVGLKAPLIVNPDPNAPRSDQESLRGIVLRQLPKSLSDDHTTFARNATDSSTANRPSSLPPSPDPFAEEGDEEMGKSQIQEEAKLFDSDDDSVDSDSGPDDGSEFGEGDEQGGHESHEESDGELQGDASSAKRRTPRGRKRGRQGDRDYRYEGEDDGDDEDGESDKDGQRIRPPRRDPSPNWHRVLGPDDPDFEPTDEYYCSKCFRKAPKKHKRDRSPLGRSKEIELHYDSTRCCGIRRGIGSIKRLPNRSGWIPASIMPKPLSNLRKRFLRRYPSYSRTLYPLSATNANGTYWRSDPNNDDNQAWWSIPWPPYRGPSPLPSGWVAPGVADAPVAGKARQPFQLKPVADPTYRQGKDDVQASDDDEDVESDGKRKRKSRPFSAFTSETTDPTPTKKGHKTITKKAEKTTTQGPLRRRKTPMLQKVLKANAAAPKGVTKKKKTKNEETEKAAPVRRSMRKRQKTG